MADINDGELFLNSSFKNYLGDKQKKLPSDRAYIVAYDTQYREAIENAIRCNQWAQGFVTGVHDSTLGLMNGGIAKRIINSLTDKIIDKFRFEGDDATVKFMYGFVQEDALKNKLRKAVSDCLTRGSQLIKLNLINVPGDGTIEQKLTFTTEPLGRFDVEKVFGLVKRIRTFIKMIEGPQIIARNKQNYFIMEERFYDDMNKPKIIFKVYVSSNTGNDFISAKAPTEIPTKEIPNFILGEAVKLGLDLNVETELPFDNLGCWYFNATDSNRKWPDVWFGESVLDGLTDLLWAYDHGLTLKEHDKYLGKGQALIPGLAANGKPLYAAGASPWYKFVPSMTSEEQRMVVYQHDIRAMEWRIDLDGLKGDIANIVGISPAMLDSRLTGGVEKTATEINVESDTTKATIEGIRSLMTSQLNTMLQTICKFFAVDGEIRIEFSQATLVNTASHTDQVIAKVNARLISREDALKELYPDLSENEILEMSAKRKLEEEAYTDQFEGGFNIGKPNEQQSGSE